MPVLDALFPGVAEAGAAGYAGRWFTRSSPEDRARLRKAVAALSREARARHARAIARLDRSEMEGLVAWLLEEDAAVFWFLRSLALEAGFAHPVHGGNKDGWGWRLVGAGGDPQPRGFTPLEVATAAPVTRPVVAPPGWFPGAALAATTRTYASSVSARREA